MFNKLKVMRLKTSITLHDISTLPWNVTNLDSLRFLPELFFSYDWCSQMIITWRYGHVEAVGMWSRTKVCFRKDVIYVQKYCVQKMGAKMVATWCHVSGASFLSKVVFVSTGNMCKELP